MDPSRYRSNPVGAFPWPSQNSHRADLYTDARRTSATNMGYSSGVQYRRHSSVGARERSDVQTQIIRRHSNPLQGRSVEHILSSVRDRTNIVRAPSRAPTAHREQDIRVIHRSASPKRNVTVKTPDDSVARTPNGLPSPSTARTSSRSPMIVEVPTRRDSTPTPSRSPAHFEVRDNGMVPSAIRRTLAGPTITHAPDVVSGMRNLSLQLGQRNRSLATLLTKMIKEGGRDADLLTVLEHTQRMSEELSALIRALVQNNGRMPQTVPAAQERQVESEVHDRLVLEHDKIRKAWERGQDTIHWLSAKKGEAEEEAGRLEVEAQKLRTENGTLSRIARDPPPDYHAAMKVAEDELTRLRDAVTRLSKQLHESQSSLQAERTRADQLEASSQQLAQNAPDVVALQEQLEVVSSDRDAQVIKVNRLQLSVTCLQERLDMLEANAEDVGTLKSRVLDLTCQRDIAATDKTRLQVTIARLEFEAQERQDELQALRRRLDAKDQGLAEAHKHCRVLQETIRRSPPHIDSQSSTPRGTSPMLQTSRSPSITVQEAPKVSDVADLKPSPSVADHVSKLMDALQELERENESSRLEISDISEQTEPPPIFVAADRTGGLD